MGFPTRSDKTKAVQEQKMAKGLKFIDFRYYLGNEKQRR